MKESVIKEGRALNTLLNEGVRFKVGVKVFRFNLKIPFRIKPLRLGTILHISKQRLKVKVVTEEAEVLWEMFDKSENVKAFAKCIAVSVLNSRVKIKLFSPLLANFLLWRLSVKEVHDLMTVVVSQMNARDFFFTTALVRGIQIVDRTKKTDQNTAPKKQSGEQSEKSQKN